MSDELWFIYGHRENTPPPGGTAPVRIACLSLDEAKKLIFEMSLEQPVSAVVVYLPDGKIYANPEVVYRTAGAEAWWETSPHPHEDILASWLRR